MARKSGGKEQPPRKEDGRACEAITDRLPAWVEVRGGKKVLVPKRAAVVRRIFEMATGEGIAATVARLTEEKVPTFGGRVPVQGDDGRPVLHTRGRDKGKPKYRATGGGYGSGVWTRAYVAKILKDRRALGEYQPRGKGRKPDGDPIPDYFPAVVSPAEFKAAQKAAAQRKRWRGRPTEDYVNVFAGLMRDARGQEPSDTYFITTDRGSGQGVPRRVLVNNAGAEGRAKYCSFPAEAFERGVFSCLREIDPHEIINGDEAPDEAQSLAGEHAAVENELAEAAAFMDAHGFSPTIGRRVTELENRLRDVAERLAAAQEKAAHPLSAAWGEAQTLLGALDSAPDPREARLRLRSALRRIVDSVWLLVVRRGLCRLCAVQVWFADGKRHRDYLILSRQAQGGGRQAATRPGGWWARSLSALTKHDDLDLRDPTDAHALERLLLRQDLEQLAAQLAEK
jgi:hypothetical protein